MNVYEATKQRIKYVFEECDNVYVSFSGGKDSGVLLNMVIDYVRQNPGLRFSLMHIDYEAQYQMTTDYVDDVIAQNADIMDVYRICLPIAAQCATSMTQSFWIPWDAEKRDIWVRQLPTHDGVINEQNCPFEWFFKGMQDYDLQNKFGRWLHKKNKATRTASLIGIRTQESQNRWQAIHGAKRLEETKYNNIAWSTEMGHGVFNFYPIFDWQVEDVWTANAQQGWAYNKLYDLFHMAGVALGSQRVASPFNDCATESLKLYKVIDPSNWAKMVGRTDGVNFAGLYGGTTAMGWKSISLPKGYTWKQYMEFLLSTLPSEVAEGYKKKLKFSQDYWRNKGGSLSPETVQLLKEKGLKIEVSNTPNNHSVFKDHLPVRMDYLDDIDIPDFRLIPTYKRMCICIMKNDLQCKYMGFGATRTEMQIRAKAALKYSHVYTDKTAKKWSEK